MEHNQHELTRSNAPGGSSAANQTQTAPVSMQGQVTASTVGVGIGVGNPGSVGTGLSHRFKRRLARFGTRAYSVALAVCFMVFFQFAPAFAQSKGGKIKELGQTLFDNIRTYGLIIAGCGLGVLAVVGLILITFSGIQPSWKQKGGEMIKFGVIGCVGLALLSVVLPAFMELINGLGGDTVELPTGGK